MVSSVSSSLSSKMSLSMIYSFLTKKLIKQIMMGTVSAAMIMFMWEHLGRKRGLKCRPSSGLTVCAEYSQSWCKQAGKFVAWLSSYLTKIDMNDLLETTSDLTKPLVGICVSPCFFFYGYYKGAIEYVRGTEKQSSLVYAGSVLGIGVICFLTTRYQLWTITKTLLSRLPTMTSNFRPFSKITN